MGSPLSESPLTQLIPCLYKSRGHSMDDVGVGLNIPHTVIYEHNFPKGLFFTDSKGSLQRRSGKDIDSKTVGEFFNAPSVVQSESGSGSGGTVLPAGGGGGGGDDGSDDDNNGGRGRRKKKLRCDIAAVYIEKRSDKSQYNVQYFTEDTLRAFLLGSRSTTGGGSGGGSSFSQSNLPQASSSGGGGGENGGALDSSAQQRLRASNQRVATHVPNIGALHARPSAEETTASTLAQIKLSSKNGILQRFVHPLGINNHVIQVIWTTHFCLAEKITNISLLTDTCKPTYERAATYQAAPGRTKRSYIAPRIADEVRLQCETLAEHIYNLEHRVVAKMTLYFKVDADEKLWFLWCPKLMYEDEMRQEYQLQDEAAEAAAQRGPNIRASSLLRRRSASTRGGGVDGASPFSSSSSPSPSSSFNAHQAPQRRQEPSVKGTAAATTSASILPEFMPMVDSVKKRPEQTRLTDQLLKACRKGPTMRLNCLDTSSGHFSNPAKSRLCPQMRWRQNSNASLLEAHETSLFVQRNVYDDVERGHHTRRSGSEGAEADHEQHRKKRQSESQDSGGGDHHHHHHHHRGSQRKATMAQAQSASATPANDPLQSGGTQKKHFTIDDIPEHIVQKYSSGGSGGGGGGTYVNPSLVVADLVKQPVHKMIGPRTHMSVSNVTGKEEEVPNLYYETMQQTKSAISDCLTFIQVLRDSAYSHFLMRTRTSLDDENSELPPLPFCVPLPLITSSAVKEALLILVADCFAPCSMQEAIALDAELGRCTPDEISQHHEVWKKYNDPKFKNNSSPSSSPNVARQPNQRPILENYPCFRIPTQHSVNSFCAKLNNFCLVVLRNVHADVEYSLICMVTKGTAGGAATGGASGSRSPQMRSPLTKAHT